MWPKSNENLFCFSENKYISLQRSIEVHICGAYFTPYTICTTYRNYYLFRAMRSGVWFSIPLNMYVRVIFYFYCKLLDHFETWFWFWFYTFIFRLISCCYLFVNYFPFSSLSLSVTRFILSIGFIPSFTLSFRFRCNFCFGFWPRPKSYTIYLKIIHIWWICWAKENEKER